MASSIGSTRDCTPVSTNKSIPLLCTVCPDVPRFSDVSHLLTHIASKGHLHHETQTKLKAHQDIAASVTLQQYERWYKDNGIETLLVERMRAKQKKEAVRIGRTRDSTPFGPSKSKRKGKRPNQRNSVKREELDLPEDYSLFSGLSPSENDVELDEESISSDMLSLKGQVWPGMGKMDLANEDMKRTRNQRKPNSVIEKMRRTSERIEPTQVVMTPDFEVERIKGVYDSSSPIPDQEKETPKKINKAKRKRTQVLAEISVNVPRRGRRPSSRRNTTAKATSSTANESMNDMLLRSISNASASRPGHDIFHDDENGVTGMVPEDAQFYLLRVTDIFGERLFAAPTPRHDQRLDAGNRLGLRHYSCLSHSPLVSPSPPSRDGPPRLFSQRDASRTRTSGGFCDTYNGHPNFPAAHLPGSSFATNDSSMYSFPPRFSFTPCSNVGIPGNDIFHFAPNHHLQPKQEGHPHAAQRDLLDGTGNPHFLHMSQSNPLLTQDRSLFGSYHAPEPLQTLSSLNFEGLNQPAEHTQKPAIDQEAKSLPIRNIKLEQPSTEMVDEDMSGECKHSGFTENGVWINTDTLGL